MQGKTESRGGNGNCGQVVIYKKIILFKKDIRSMSTTTFSHECPIVAIFIKIFFKLHIIHLKLVSYTYVGFLFLFLRQDLSS